VWRSLVAHLLWEQGAGGSNPLTPTILNLSWGAHGARLGQPVLRRRVRGATARPVVKRGHSKQVAFVVKALGLQRGTRVLDVPCGFGRHARLLARRGMVVVGVDLSSAMIAEARRSGPQPGLSFVRADMRRLTYQGEFDAVLNLYTSFGYFSPHANLDVLRRAPASMASHISRVVRSPDAPRVVR
jgi:SAM-dependent methyltransferase